MNKVSLRALGLWSKRQGQHNRWNGLLALVARSFLVSGLALLAICMFAALYGWISSRLALREFDKIQAAPAEVGSRVPLDRQDNDGIDFSLSSEKRIRAYRESLLIRKDLPLAVLRIERLRIRVPVFEGTDDFVLNRGVGWIIETTRPGELGTIGIAG